MCAGTDSSRECKQLPAASVGRHEPAGLLQPVLQPDTRGHRGLIPFRLRVPGGGLHRHRHELHQHIAGHLQQQPEHARRCLQPAANAGGSEELHGGEHLSAILQYDSDIVTLDIMQLTSSVEGCAIVNWGGPQTQNSRLLKYNKFLWQPEHADQSLQPAACDATPARGGGKGGGGHIRQPFLLTAYSS